MTAREQIAEVLVAHEEFGGGRFCRCTPLNDDETRDPLPVYWEDHLAAAIAAALPDPEQAVREARGDRHVRLEAARITKGIARGDAS